MFVAYTCPTAPLSAMAWGKPIGSFASRRHGKVYLKSLFVGGAILGLMLHIHITWYLHVFTNLVNLSLL